MQKQEFIESDMEKVKVEIKPGCEELFSEVVEWLNELYDEAMRIAALPPKNLQEIEVDEFYIDRVADYADWNRFKKPISYHWGCSIPGVLIASMARSADTVYVELRQGSLKPRLSEYAKSGQLNWVFK